MSADPTAILVIGKAMHLLGPNGAPVSPRCRMCARDARWNKQRSEFSAYCSGASCSNRNRLCQNCETEFTIGIDGAGTKYCSQPCKLDGYHPTKLYQQQWKCVWCGKHSESNQGPRSNRNPWPYICYPCIEPIAHVLYQLKQHRVTHERARRLISDPHCEICGRDIIELVRNNRGEMKHSLVIDHDHSCCPGSKSCGQCVRGFLCTTCNTAIGMIYENPATALALANYLKKTKTEE